MAKNPLPVEPLAGRRFGLVADAHVHPGGGPDLPETVLEAFAGVDAVIALGDMGERPGLDRLATVAPVLGVRGADDADDPRVAAELRLFSHGSRLIGAVFDGTRHGLYVSNNPFEVVRDFPDALRAVFGEPVGVVLCAGSHEPLLGWRDGVLIVNPGSPTLAHRCTVAILHLADDHVRAEHLTV